MYSLTELFAMGIVMLWILAVCAVVSVLSLIAHWKLFVKAGEKGWKVLIPFYATYKIYDIVWTGAMFWPMLAAAITGSLLSALWPANIPVLIVSWIFLIFCAVIDIMRCFKMSKAYGHGTGFGFGLMFFNTIFACILAFGKSEYKGRQN